MNTKTYEELLQYYTKVLRTSVTVSERQAMSTELEALKEKKVRILPQSNRIEDYLPDDHYIIGEVPAFLTKQCNTDPSKTSDTEKGVNK